MHVQDERVHVCHDQWHTVRYETVWVPELLIGALALAHSCGSSGVQIIGGCRYRVRHSSSNLLRITALAMCLQSQVSRKSIPCVAAAATCTASTNAFWGSAPASLPPSHTPRPEYYAYQLYADHFGPTLVDVTQQPTDIDCPTWGGVRVS